MPRVLLKRPAFLDNALCDRGSIVDIGSNIAIADYMTVLSDAAPAKTVTGIPVVVHVHSKTHALDIDVGGVAMHVDNAVLEVEKD